MENSENLPKIPLVVGYAFADKKINSMKSILTSSDEGLVWRPINLNILTDGKSLENQGPFDIVIHKLSEDIYEVNESPHSSEHSSASHRISSIEEFSLMHPEVPIVDPPIAISRVVSRIKTCELLTKLHGTHIGHQYQLTSSDGKNIKYHHRCMIAPKFIIASKGITYETASIIEKDLIANSIPLDKPFLCKPVEACGPGASHMLTILLDKPSVVFQPSSDSSSSLNSESDSHQNYDLSWLQQPSIIQEYVNHGGILLKVYMIGDAVRYFIRQSLPDLPKTESFRDIPTLKPLVDNVADEDDALVQTKAKLAKKNISNNQDHQFCNNHNHNNNINNNNDNEVMNKDVKDEETLLNIGTKKKKTPRGIVLFESQKPYPSFKDLLYEGGYYDMNHQRNDVYESSSHCPQRNICEENQHLEDDENLSSCIQDAAKKLSEVFGLSLFGFDCVIPSDSQDLMILDVNYFPGYKEMKQDFPTLLRTHFINLKQKKSIATTTSSSSSSSLLLTENTSKKSHQPHFIPQHAEDP